MPALPSDRVAGRPARRTSRCLREAILPSPNTMDKFQPATVPAHVIRIPGDYASSGSARIDPNPIFAELQRMGPPPKPVRKMHRPRKPKPPKGAAAPPAAETPFPTRRLRPRRLRRPHRLRRRLPADCLHCTTQRHQTRCRLCRGRNVPTLRSRAPLPDVTAAAPKGTFE